MEIIELNLEKEPLIFNNQEIHVHDNFKLSIIV